MSKQFIPNPLILEIEDYLRIKFNDNSSSLEELLDVAIEVISSPQLRHTLFEMRHNLSYYKEDDKSLGRILSGLKRAL